MPDAANEQTTPAFSVGRRRWRKEGVGGREVCWRQQFFPRRCKKMQIKKGSQMTLN